MNATHIIGPKARLWTVSILFLMAISGGLTQVSAKIDPEIVPDAPSGVQELNWTVDFPGSVMTVALSADGTTAVLLPTLDQIYVMKIDQPEPILKINYSNRVVAVAISGNGSRFAVTLHDEKVLVYDIRYANPIWTKPLETSHGYMLAVTEDGNRVVYGDNDTIFLMDGNTGREIQTWDCRGAGGISQDEMVKFSPDGNSIIAMETHSLARFDASNRAPTWTFQPPTFGTISVPEVEEFAASSDLSKVAVLVWESDILWFLDGNTGETIWNRSLGTGVWLGGVSLDSSGRRLSVLTNEYLLYRIETDSINMRSRTIAPSEVSWFPSVEGNTAMDSIGSMVAVAVNLQGGNPMVFPTSGLFVFQWDHDEPDWRFIMDFQLFPKAYVSQDGSHVIVTDLLATRVFNSDGDLLQSPGNQTGPGSSPLGPVMMTYLGPIALVVLLTFTIGAITVTEPGRLAVHAPLTGLFTRLKRNDVLEQQTRARILTYVTMNPGAHYSIIRDGLGLANGHAAYHLKVLCREGQLRPRRHGRRVHFYIPESPADRAALPDGTVDEILTALIRRSPGATQVEVGTWSGFDQSTVSRALGRLLEAGTIQRTEKGHQYYYWPEQAGTGPSKEMTVWHRTEVAAQGESEVLKFDDQ